MQRHPRRRSSWPGCPQRKKVPERVPETLAEESVDRAINRVLAAERDARLAVEGCRRQAQEIIEAARFRARRIDDQVGHRVAAVHARADLTVGRAVAALRAEGHALGGEALLDEADLVRLERALLRLTAEMIGTPE